MVDAVAVAAVVGHVKVLLAFFEVVFPSTVRKYFKSHLNANVTSAAVVGEVHKVGVLVARSNVVVGHVIAEKGGGIEHALILCVFPAIVAMHPVCPRVTSGHKPLRGGSCCRS